jgi:hypothetical protein
MNHKLFSGVTLTCLACILPTVATAQDCEAPANCVITRPRPVVSTQLRAQQITTFRDVTETQVCHKQVVENIPVTTCKSVTVDEGGYQMVWVPKPVTKQVSQTTVRQQVKTVAVQYVNETVPVQMTAMASTCDTCGNGQTVGMQMFAPQMGAIAPIYQPAQYQPAPYQSALIPTMPAIAVPSYQSAEAPTLRAQSPSAPVPNSYEETVPARSVPTPRDEATSAPRKTSMFRGVPSAAAAWQRQSSYAR